MSTRLWMLLAPFATLLAIPQSARSGGLGHADLARLAALHPHESYVVAAFPLSATETVSLRLQRVEIYAPNARVWVVSAEDRHEAPRSDRIFLRGDSDDGRVTVALSLEPDGRFVAGAGNGPAGPFTLRSTRDAHGGEQLRVVPTTLPPDFQFDFRCGDENIDLGLHASPGPADLAASLRRVTADRGRPNRAPASVTSGSPSPLRYATVAIDTDSEFLSRLFANNTTNAINWIANLFNTMNTMYENNLQVHLLIGTTILRTSSANDPYTGLAQNQPANRADLDLFAAYWQNNESSVPRAFAILLSGAIASVNNGCSASGIAWINEYCNTGQSFGSDTVGSYSVNKVCTNITVDPNGTVLAPRLVGHELGHNLGAWHTHCTDASNGGAPVAANTIDQCFNGESTIGCYAGGTSCPMGGAGTIMSYCNVSGCGQNQLQFHATQINDVLLPAISANTPSCLLPDRVFADGFGG